ncbi:Ubiquitin conjugation factor E4 [Elasticomyces elasticus]|nr:Ubiquitin conjugation factor E4 [Elasticomyces elasticus]
MSDSTISDADKIRNKRLAKLGGSGGSNSSPLPENGTANTPSATSPPPQQSINSPKPTSPPPTSAQPNPFSQLGMKAPSSPSAAPRINIRPAAPQKRESDGTARPRSRQNGAESIETWEDRTLSSVFRISLKPDATKDVHGHPLHFAASLHDDLTEEKKPLLLSTSVLDQAITEAATDAGQPLEYLLSCWKRVARQFRGMKNSNAEDPKYNVVKEARRLCMSYCIFAATMPEMFGRESSEENPLARHLLVDPENDLGICHEFLAEAVSRFSEDDTVKDALVGAVEQLSRDLAQLSMNDNYQPYILALRNLVRYPALVEAMTSAPSFVPPDIAAPALETDTLLGPFFRLSPLQPEVALNYFSSPKTRDKAYINNSQKALRMSLQTHQEELFDIVNCIVKTAKGPRERLLDWFAAAVNANHKRRAMRVDPKQVSTDGFMINVTVCLDRLCEPFMDVSFSKIDKIDVDYLRRSPRVSIQDETKINADQKTSDDFYAQEAGGVNNFISEAFFLTVAAHHYGPEAAGAKLGQLQKEVKHMERETEKFETERHKFVNNAMQLQRFDIMVKKYKDEIDRIHCLILSTQGVLLDELSQTRSMQFMRYVIVWLLRLASGQSLPKETLRLPLPDHQPDAFKCLPEYFLEDIVGNFKFITRNMPQIITPTQCEEIVTICITFLRSSEYIKSPYLKSGLVTILFHGVWPYYANTRGVLGDVLNGSPFANKHLLHALMKFYIEAESTGTHTQFFDKFNIRYEIFQVIKCIWVSNLYRENLVKEAAINTDFFVRFVNLLLNDATFVLDESFSSFIKIHELTAELRDTPTGAMEEAVRKEKEELLADSKSRAKSYMGLTTETVAMLKLFTEALADAFTMPEIVQRLADMLDYNLDALTGPKQSNLKVEHPEEYGFNPRQMLADIVDVYINLSQKTSFHVAIARDGRSYKPSNFTKATEIMQRYSLKSPDELHKWRALISSIAAAKEADEQADQDLGEIPEEFEDPLMATLMSDPVVLPSSKAVIDRSTIRSHLLSDPTDPFNRVPLKIEDVVPATELRERIEAFRASKRGRSGVGGAVADGGAAAAAAATEAMDTTPG